MTVTVAIECSQRQGSVALRTAAGDTFEEDLADPPRSGDDLIPALDRLVHTAGVRPADISLVGVSIGPGSFTGIRLAITAARALAMSTGAHVLGIHSALIACASAAIPDAVADRLSPRRPLLSILAVKGSEFWATEAFPDQTDGAWHPARPPGLADADTLAVSHLSGIVADAFLPTVIRERAHASDVPILQLAPRAWFCLDLTISMYARNGAQPADTLLPLYPRRPEAVRLWEARQSTRRDDPAH